MMQRAEYPIHASTSRSFDRVPLHAALLSVLLLGGACSGSDDARAMDKGATSSPAATDAKATRALWDEFGRIASDNLGTRSIRLLEEDSSMPARNLAAMLAKFAEVENARCQRLAALPMVGVDARATDLLVQWVRARQAATKALTSAAGAVEQFAALDGEHLLSGFLVNLMSAADSEEGAFQEAFLKQTSSTGDELQALRKSAESVQQQMKHAAALSTDLVPAEAAARATLAQRFGQEFPPLESYKPTPSQAAPPEAEEIPSLLLGFQLAEPDWKFESLDEFTSFTVVSQTRKAPDHIEARVRTTVRGNFSGVEHELVLTVHLLHFCGEWYAFDLSGWE